MELPGTIIRFEPELSCRSYSNLSALPILQSDGAGGLLAVFAGGIRKEVHHSALSLHAFCLVRLEQRPNKHHLCLMSLLFADFLLSVSLLYCTVSNATNVRTYHSSLPCNRIQTTDQPGNGLRNARPIA
jgi:hypothetical protein